jgi:CheY-like chemotaxis protein
MKTVLLAEDTEDEAFFFKQAFQQEAAPWLLQIVSDGQQAIDYLSGIGPYANRLLFPLPLLILLDIHLPSHNGFEVLQWIRSDPRLKPIPVIILASSHQAAEARQAWYLGANHYFVKPPGLPQLVEIVRIINHYWLQLSSFPTGSSSF